MEERCVCCGDVIPEGRQVCPRCQKLAIQRLIPKKRFQGRCSICCLDVGECDWGDENTSLCEENLEANFKYCPRCGQRIDWKGDDYFDNTKENCIFSPLSPCSYPFNDCKDCPANPKNNDPYWGRGVIG